MTSSSSTALHLPPGESGWPLIGEIREWIADPLEFARERAARYGPIWRTHLLGKPCVVLLEPAGNRFVLSTGAHHFSWRDGWGRSMLDLIGGGLSLTDGLEHDQRRAILRPAFSPATLQTHIGAMTALIADHCARWSALPAITLLEALKSLAFDIALLTICGPTPPAIADTLHRNFDTFTAGLFTPLSIALPGTPYARARRAGRSLRRALHTLVDQRRAAPLPDAHDALSLMLASTEPPWCDDAALVSELLLLLWAGHDTVASLLTWVCYELACHPDWFARLYAEYGRVLGDAPASAEQLRHLPDTDRVLRECERLHPPAPGGFRGVVEPFSYNGYDVPAGWLAMYSSVYTHRMPELWRDPDRFDPDRFAPPREEGKAVAFSLVGFGGGPRVCIGAALAQMEMRLVLIELVRGYRWTLLPDQDLSRVWLPTNQPKDGGRVSLQPNAARTPIKR